MEDETVKERVTADRKRDADLGVKSTPTVFLNNRAFFPTDLAPDRLRQAVSAAVNAKPPS